MKKLTLSLILLFSIFYSNAQDAPKVIDEERKNELTINVTNLIGFKWLDFGYERLINEESSFGVSTLFAIDSDNDTGLDEYRTFSITPYYRHFFSRKYAQGFFVEGFTMLHTGKDEFYLEDFNGGVNYREESFTDLAIGVSAGAKFLTRRGFIAEIYLGIGRDLLGNSDDEIVGRGGISLGYRFK